MDTETIAYCNAHNISLVSFSTLSAGVPMDNPTLSAVAGRHNVSNAAVMLRFVSAHGISILSSISSPEYTAEDIGIFDFELTSADMAELAALQTEKRTCSDCYTTECQDCAKALNAAGCQAGNIPVAGRDNPNAVACLACAAEHNQTIMQTCHTAWMIPKACGQAGGFPHSR